MFQGLINVGRRVTFGAARVGAAGASKGFHFIADHPSTLVAPAAIAGFASEHAFRRGSTAYSNMVYGDPNALRDVTMGTAINGVFGDLAYGQRPGYSFNVTRNGITPGITTESPQYSANPDVDQMLRAQERSNPNPDGSIVFGLHNQRLR